MAEKLWVAQYMRETDSIKRKTILDQAVEEEGMLPENELRCALYDARYQVQDGRGIDCFIRGLMLLKFLESSSTGFFGGKRTEREKRKIAEDWQLERAKAYGETGETVLYQEFFNTAKLYIELCRNDSSYRSVLFGLGRMKDEKMIAKLANEFYKLGYTIPARCDMREDLAPFTRALTDAFCELFDRNKDALLNLIAEKQ